MNKNSKLVRIFEDLSAIYSMRKEKWKPQAYRVAAKSIEQLREDVSQIYKKQGLKGLEKISGVGESIGKKIIEFLKTGKIKTYEKLKKHLDGGILDLVRIPGLGPRRAKLLREKLGIKTVKDLERAAKKGLIRKLPTFKEKFEKNILEGIEVFRSGRGRMELKVALKEAKRILGILKKVPGVKRVSEAGSVRRRQETIGDLDLIVTSSRPRILIDKFCKLKGVKKVQAKGKTKASVLMKNNLQIDIRVVPDYEYGAALQYFTGNKAHNINLRRIAIKKGMKLNEYGLFLKGKRVAGKTESGIYSKLGLKMVKPENRIGKDELKKN